MIFGNSGAKSQHEKRKKPPGLCLEVKVAFTNFVLKNAAFFSQTHEANIRGTRL